MSDLDVAEAGPQHLPTCEVLHVGCPQCNPEFWKGTRWEIKDEAEVAEHGTLSTSYGPDETDLDIWERDQEIERARLR